MTFAASGPGAIALQCGTKHANVHLRLERWDEQPPAAEDDWEDRDLLPWRTVAGGGRLLGHGYEEDEDEDALDLGDLDIGRVEVLAAGRHRYGYSDFPDDGMPPEEWLLRLWPTAHPVDALSGPPRRIAGPMPFTYPGRDPFQAAIHSWSQAGWRDALNSIPAWYEIELALRRVGRPATAPELAEGFGPWGSDRDSDGAYTWDSPVRGRRTGRERPPSENLHNDLLEQLAAAADMPTIATFADLLNALRVHGLLADWNIASGARLVPNPAPRPIWEVLPQFAVGQVRHWKIQALAADYMSLEGDIRHLLRWAPDRRLSADLRRIALRLSLMPADVVGVLRLLEMRGKLTVDPTPELTEPTAPILVTAAAR
jgi:hypothetical protein